MDVLLTFAGNRDPFNPEAVEGDFTDGPVLTLLSEKQIQRIYIFTTPNTLLNAQGLRREIIARYQESEIRIFNIDIPDPTDYEELYLHMYKRCQEIMTAHETHKPEYYIATASGTPQMQTIWFLLAQSGLVPSILLKITPPRFLKPGQKAVSEIKLSLETFPHITSPSQRELEIETTYLRIEKLEAERKDILLQFSQYKMIGESHQLERIKDTIKAASQYDSSVLIQGATGTGKELVAQAIHFNSLRKEEPFIVVNCAAIPESLIESELFGHEKGAFTGAIQQKKGRFELADKGTIFLDEVGDMPLSAQAKVLRALQDKEITRVGGTKTIKTDVRLIAATNRNLAALISEEKFREDLYYRLKVIDIQIPTLRERREDIPLLISYFLGLHNHRYKRQKQLTRETMKLLFEYDWPGNIRELENTIERAFVLSTGNIINETDLPQELSSGETSRIKEKTSVRIPTAGMDFDTYLNNLERKYYEEAIKIKDGNREAAARLLNIKPHTFRKRAKEKFGL